MQRDHVVLLDAIQFNCQVDRHRALTDHLATLARIHSDDPVEQNAAFEVGNQMVVYISILLYFMMEDGWMPVGKIPPNVIPTRKAFDKFAETGSLAYSFHSYREMADIAANTLFLKDPETDKIRPLHIRSIIKDSVAHAFDAFEVNGGYLETKLPLKEYR